MKILFCIDAIQFLKQTEKSGGIIILYNDNVIRQINGSYAQRYGGFPERGIINRCRLFMIFCF